MCTFLGSLETAFSPEAVGKDVAMGRADNQEGKKHVSPVYGLFAPQSGESPEWRKMKMCVLLLPDERAARPSTDASRRPDERSEL